jgi:hypothetical protein
VTTYFFIHVMKTGGSTFFGHIRANFGRDAIYPNRAGGDPRKSYIQIPHVLALPPERRAQITIYCGHFPYFVTDLLGHPELVRMTVLRHPVDRTVSMLRQTQAEVQPESSLETIYSDYAYRHRLVANHMTKMFSMTADDGATVYFKVLPMDLARLEHAKENLERVQILGFQEHYHEFLDELRRDWGWQIGEVENRRVRTEDSDVPQSLLDRIAEDNVLDLDLYDFALSLRESRVRDSSSESRNDPNTALRRL